MFDNIEREAEKLASDIGMEIEDISARKDYIRAELFGSASMPEMIKLLTESRFYAPFFVQITGSLIKIPVANILALNFPAKFRVIFSLYSSNDNDWIIEGKVDRYETFIENEDPQWFIHYDEFASYIQNHNTELQYKKVLT